MMWRSARQNYCRLLLSLHLPLLHCICTSPTYPDSTPTQPCHHAASVLPPCCHRAGSILAQCWPIAGSTLTKPGQPSSRLCSISKPNTLALLENARQAAIPDIVVKLQTSWRGWLARRYVRRLRAVAVIKRMFKMYKVRPTRLPPFIIRQSSLHGDCGFMAPGPFATIPSEEALPQINRPFTPLPRSLFSIRRYDASG